MNELRAICRQYDQLTRGTDQQRRKAAMIERAAKETQGGIWDRALMESCCKGVRYEHLKVEALKSSNRNAFFAARREFYSRLDDLTRDAF